MNMVDKALTPAFAAMQWHDLVARPFSARKTETSQQKVELSCARPGETLAATKAQCFHSSPGICQCPLAEDHE